MTNVISYKGFGISYSEKRDEFVAEREGHDDIKNESIPLLKKAIDAYRKKKFGRVPAFQISGERFIKVTITSVTPNGEVWISYRERNELHREKVWRSGGLYVETTLNKRHVAEYNDIKKEINALQRKQNAITKKMELFRAKPQ